MWASSPASDSALLAGLIAACEAFATLSLCVWLTVFLVRSRRLQRLGEIAAAEEELTRFALDRISGYAPDTKLPVLPGWKRDILRRVLRELIEQTKGRDQTALIQLADRVGLRAAALQDLRHAGAARRQEACRVLAYFDDDAAIHALHRSLQDRDGAVRLCAAHALLLKDRIDSLRSLLSALAFPEDDPPLMLSDLFARLPERLLPEAVALLSEPIPGEWLRMLAIALARRQYGDAFEGIARLRNSRQPRLRAAAWVALRALGDPRAGDLVLQGLRDPEADVRRAAAECAGALGGPDAVPALVTLLDDGDWWVRYHAAAALWELGPVAREALSHHNTAASHDTGRQFVREKEEAGHVR